VVCGRDVSVLGKVQRRRPRKAATCVCVKDGSGDREGIEMVPPAYDELRERLKRTNVFLVGMMGSGKTTLGHELARGLRYMFLDTDEIVEKLARKPVSQIFDQEGEQTFRRLEHAVLDEVQSYIGCVVSTGGGIVMDQTNWGPLQTGLVVWLNPSVDTLFERVKDDGTRPLLQVTNPKAKLESILENRREMYAQADVTVEVESKWTTTEIAFETVRMLNNFIKSHPPRAKKVPPSIDPMHGA